MALCAVVAEIMNGMTYRSEGFVPLTDDVLTSHKRTFPVPEAPLEGAACRRMDEAVA
jgi:hypothetical protein